MNDWQVDREMTLAVEHVFADYKPTVRHRNAQQYLLDNTPFGTVEIVPLDQKGLYLIAAAHPPARLPATRIPENILTHLSKHRLVPWRYQHASTVLEVMYSLNALEQANTAIKWSPYAVEVTSVPEQVIGEQRQQLVSTTEALVRASQDGGPIPALYGPRGVGKHTLTSTLAGRLRLQAVEVPLFRVVIPRVLQTGLEALTEMLVEWTQQEVGQVLMVLSDGELIDKALPSTYRHLVIQEISRLPNVLLLANAVEPLGAPMVTQVRCRGLTSLQELRELLNTKAGMGQVQLTDAALKLLGSAAQHPEFGMLPGRALHAFRLSLLLKQAPHQGEAVLLSPDDVIPGLNLAAKAWEVSTPDPNTVS